MTHRLGEEDDDPRDKLDPTVRYLQRLGLKDMETIFTWSRWVIDENRDIGLRVSVPCHSVDSFIVTLTLLQIYTLEESPLPRPAVTDFLQRIDPALAIQYIEHLIDELHETSPAFHDRLVDLYLESVTRYGLAGKQGASSSSLAKHFSVRWRGAKLAMQRTGTSCMPSCCLLSRRRHSTTRIDYLRTCQTMVSLS